MVGGEGDEAGRRKGSENEGLKIKKEPSNVFEK